MPDLTVHCTHCSAPLKLKDSSRLGSKVKCPKCGQPFVLQGGDDEWGDLEPVAPAPSSGRTAPVVSRSGGTKTGTKKRKTSGGMSGATKGLLIGVSVLVLLIVAGVGLWASGIFSSPPQGDAVAQSTPAQLTTSGTPTAAIVDPSQSTSQPAASDPATTTVKSNGDAATPTVASAESQPAAETGEKPIAPPHDNPANNLSEEQAEKLLSEAIRTLLAGLVDPDDAKVREAIMKLMVDEETAQRVFGAIGKETWLIMKEMADEVMTKIPELRARQAAFGGANTQFRVFDWRKQNASQQMQALLAVIPADVPVFGVKLQTNQGGRPTETEFLDFVIVNGEIRTVTSLSLLQVKLADGNKLPIPQIVARPLVELDDAGRTFAGKEAGQTRTDNDLKLTLVWCPPGKFRMGTPEGDVLPSVDVSMERPVEVELSAGFWIGQTEVTQSQWKAVMGTEPWADDNSIGRGDTFPASEVLWKEAVEFCRVLTERERQAQRLPVGWKYALPTEAQWEFACRAGTDTLYSCDGSAPIVVSEYAWVRRFGQSAPRVEHPQKVASKKPNPWGIHDMHGNVAEWCRDWFFDHLPGGTDPLGPAIGEVRVLRGGSYQDEAGLCRSASRMPDSLVGQQSDPRYGFRVAIVRAMVDEAAR